MFPTVHQVRKVRKARLLRNKLDNHLIPQAIANSPDICLEKKYLSIHVDGTLPNRSKWGFAYSEVGTIHYFNLITLDGGVENSFFQKVLEIFFFSFQKKVDNHSMAAKAANTLKDRVRTQNNIDKLEEQPGKMDVIQ